LKVVIRFAGETFCHTLHIMDSKGTSVLVNKKCTTDKECQRNKVGCVEIDSQKVHSEGYAERSWADVCPVADVRVLLRPGLLQHPRPHQLL
jgi:hypothetical protein